MAQEKQKLLNNSINKACSLLNYFTLDKDVIGLSELSRISGMPKATVYRLMTTMEENGFIRKVNIIGRENQYRLGLKLLELGKLVSEQLEIREVAMPYMKDLRDKVNECVQLIVRDKNEAIYIEKLEGDRHVRLYTRVGRRAPLYGGACPRAILSFMEDEEIECVLKVEQLEAITSNTITNKENLMKSIEEARKIGYTVSYGELELESVAVGAPIFDSQGKVIASISIAGPEYRFKEKEMIVLIDELLKVTHKISQKFGFKKPQVVE